MACELPLKSVSLYAQTTLTSGSLPSLLMNTWIRENLVSRTHHPAHSFLGSFLSQGPEDNGDMRTLTVFAGCCIDSGSGR